MRVCIIPKVYYILKGEDLVRVGPLLACFDSYDAASAAAKFLGGEVVHG